MIHYPDPDPRTMTCRGCGQTVQEYPGYGGHVRHAKPQQARAVKERCGAAMRYGETCARFAGHARGDHDAGHKTRYAMDNQMLSRRAA